MSLRDSNAPPRQSATLIVEHPLGMKRHALKSPTTIGRDPLAGLYINHPTVSRGHARLIADATGWCIQDLGAQNGTFVDETRLDGAVPLGAQASIRFGQVRAWFFAGVVPAKWSADGQTQAGGKLVRCRCGHIGWAPTHVAGMLLNCVACGREIVVDDRLPKPIEPAATPPEMEPAHAMQTCAACHTALVSGEPTHTCGSCEATMHQDCWEQNRGCATYGCDQVNVLDADDAEHIDRSGDDASDITETGVDESPSTRSRLTRGLWKVLGLGMVGLVLFGVPAIATAVYRVVAGGSRAEGAWRFGWTAMTFAAGVIGFAFSGWLWLGI